MKLVERVFAKLGFAAKPKPDRAGLEALYAAWCRHVPFDNLRKRIALGVGLARSAPGRTARGLPRRLPRARDERNLLAVEQRAARAGCGLRLRRAAHLGLDVRPQRPQPRQPDRPPRRRGVAGRLVDAVRRSRSACSGAWHRTTDDPVHPIRVEPVEDGFRIHWSTGRSADTLPCRLMQDPVDEKFYLERYEISRGYSVFNNALYARRSFPGKLVNLIGRTRFEKTAQGRHEPRARAGRAPRRVGRRVRLLARDRRELREDRRLRLSGARDGTRPAPALRARRPRGRRGSLGLPVLRSRHAAPDLVEQLASRAELLPRRQQGSRGVAGDEVHVHARRRPASTRRTARGPGSTRAASCCATWPTT